MRKNRKGRSRRQGVGLSVLAGVLALGAARVVLAQTVDQSVVNPAVAEAIRVKCEQQGIAESIRILQDNASTPEDQKRAIGFLASIKSDGDPAIPALAAAIRRDDPGVRREATQAIVCLGTSAGPALIDAIRDHDPDVRAAVVDAIGQMWSTDASLTKPSAETALAALSAALNDEDPAVERDAAETLSRLGPSANSALPALVTALKARPQHSQGVSADRASRADIAEAIAEIGPPAQSALTDALKDDDPAVREAAANGLGIMGSAASPGVPALIVAVHDTDFGVRRDAFHALCRIGPAAAPAVPLLVGDLKNRQPSERSWAAYGLWAIGPPAATEATPALERARHDNDAAVRALAAKTLGRIGSPAQSAEPTLIAALHDADPDVRKWAAGVLIWPTLLVLR
jgi:HEAT repeat protein